MVKAAETSFWDDPEVQVSSEWARLDVVGDQVEGTIAKLGKKVWPDGGVSVEIMFREDDAPALTAGQVLLKQALATLKPVPGDFLAVTLGEIERRAGGKSLKRFVVSIKRANGETETVDQTEKASF